MVILVRQIFYNRFLQTILNLAVMMYDLYSFIEFNFINSCSLIDKSTSLDNLDNNTNIY